MVSSSTGPHLSALLKDVTVAGVVIARGPRLAVHVRDVRGSWVQLQVLRELYVCLENTFLVLQVFVFVLFGWFTRSRVERMWSRLNWSLRFVNTYLADELQPPSSSAVNITPYLLRGTMICWYISLLVHLIVYATNPPIMASLYFGIWKQNQLKQKKQNINKQWIQIQI